MTVFISMFLFALIGAISPGPVNIIATSSGASFGFRSTLPHVLGATFAYTLIVFLVGTGLNQVLLSYPQITTSLQYLGAAFLLYMSYKIATANTSNEQARTTSQPPSLLQGAMAQGLNPKAWLVSMSGVSLFVSANSPASFYLLMFCLISFLVCFIGIACWAALGQMIRNLLNNPGHQRLFNIAMGLLLSSTVVNIFLNQ
ncbi:MAG: LysE family translocator [Motiliproteus sp.]